MTIFVEKLFLQKSTSYGTSGRSARGKMLVFWSSLFHVFTSTHQIYSILREYFCIWHIFSWKNDSKLKFWTSNYRFWLGRGEHMKKRGSKYEHFASYGFARAAIWGRLLQKEFFNEHRHLLTKNTPFPNISPGVSGSGRAASPTYQDLHLSHFY